MNFITELFSKKSQVVSPEIPTPAPEKPLPSPVPLKDSTRERLLAYCTVLGNRAVQHDSQAADARTHGRPTDLIIHNTLAEKTRAMITEISDILSKS